jgi:hypothetical protein
MSARCVFGFMAARSKPIELLSKSYRSDIVAGALTALKIPAYEAIWSSAAPL